MVSRCFAIVPAVLAAVSFALSVVLLVAGTGPSQAPQFFWLSFNTSNLGQGIIEITTADSPSDTTPGSGSGSGTTSPSDLFQDFLNRIRDSFDGIIGDVTDRINSGLDDLQSSILGNLTDSLGIKDSYSLYLSKICEGDLSNPNDPSSGIKTDSCVKYDETREGLRNITSSIPSSLTIGRTKISVPLVDALTSTLDGVLALGIHGSRALFALLVISGTMTGIVMLASLSVLLIGHRRFLVRVNLVASVMGGTSLLAFAVVMTALIVAGASILGNLGDSVGLEIKQGGPFLALGWVSAVLGMGAASYWFSVWFVSFRRTSFKRRERTEDEIGSWWGIFREVISDLRLPKKAG